MFKICIDTGGTFSESIVLDEKGSFHEFKLPTTPHDFSQGIINTLKLAADYFSLPVEKFLENTESIVHGTTVVTNALVQRKLARTALITTKGFRDVIEMRRAQKIETHSMYESFLPPYKPIVPRRLRFGVTEKTRYTGEIVLPVDEGELKTVIQKMQQKQVESVAICFINSYANSSNEVKTCEICKKFFGDEVYVTYSTDILPKMGEYERESTCVVNAGVGPIVVKYLTSLETNLRKLGFAGQLLIVQANQYIQSVSSIMKKPVYLTNSGPAAGPAGAVHLGRVIKEPNFLIGDMGGTTWDASLIKDNQASLKAGVWLEDDRLGIKVADVISIGAGGGSIGWLDKLGLLRVGPLSASSDPGPACYGKGGKEPTVTDAALLLGYLNPDNFCGGKIKLDKNLSAIAMQKIADPLKVSLEQAAQNIFTIVNNNMADGIAEISTKRGFDVRDFSLLAAGGGGPLCGVFVADILGMKKTVVPRLAASFCAWSMFFLDIGRDYVRSYIRPLEQADPIEMNDLFADMLREALQEFKVLNISSRDIVVEKYADVRYRGQYHEVEMKLDKSTITTADFEKLAADFHQKHNELYTVSLPWVPIEIQNLRIIARVTAKNTETERIAAGTTDASHALKNIRKCRFDGEFIDTPIYDGSKMKAGNLVTGNAILEEPSYTVVIPPGFLCRIDEYGNHIVIKQTG